ncbi:AraC family transcriptional regulator [Pseudoclostridium thermosuccinogenes]|uniref:AraC family transcriptional regulator n=1 Tax=Clostridium thermosuccinogenes TaxID=84032 RepID=UPI002FDA1C17
MLLCIDTDHLPDILNFGHVNYKEPWVHFQRITDEHILYIVISGNLYVKEGTEEYSLSKGDMLILEPNILHKGYKASCCHYFYIHFRHPRIWRVTDRPDEEVHKEMLQKRILSFTSDIASEDAGTNSICHIPKHYNLEKFEYYMQFLYDTDNDYFGKYEHYKRLVSYKLMELFIRIGIDYLNEKTSLMTSALPKAYLKARDIMGFILSEYRRKISSKEIEDKFEISYDYINKIFQKSTGHTIANYINIIRIRKAKELIETTSLKYADIAYFVGINDPYYFSKLFKKYTGMTPSQYSLFYSKIRRDE